MKRIARFSILLLIIIISFATFAYAQERNYPPTVSKIVAQPQSGTNLVDIIYDVKDPDSDKLTIKVAISNDGGKTFNVNAKTTNGDVGDGIAPGKDKKIVCDFGENTPNFSDPSCVIEIIASDGQHEIPTIIGKDGAPMVLIPAGEFLMGDSLDGTTDATPVHTVYLDAFYMDAHEVTNAQYKKFVDATGHKSSPFWTREPISVDNPNFDAPDHPVVCIGWDDAIAYADWAGKRLPTEAEWEKAARGGLVGKRYPWGDTITHDDANYSDIVGKIPWEYTYTMPVGSFPPNGYGLYDMAGNAWEWCADWYDAHYYANSPKQNPKGPDSGQERVLRGGSWLSAYKDFVDYFRVYYRLYFSPPAVVYSAVGFRCVQ